MSEQILGIDRVHLEKHLLNYQHHFFKLDGLDYQFLLPNLYFRTRQEAEVDSSFKQIIPYTIIQYQDHYLIYQRLLKQTETRLHDLFSLGFGGHINPIDADASHDIIIEGMFRELGEELQIALLEAPKYQGFINDDTSLVGQVHLGIVFLAQAKNFDFTILEKDKIQAQWVHKAQLKEFYSKMESWSQLVCQSLY